MLAAASDQRSGASIYFAFTGFMIALLLAGVHRADTVPGAAPADLYLISEFVLLGVSSIVYIAFATFGDRLRAYLHVPTWLYDAPIVLWTAAYVWAAWYLSSSEHNRFILVIAFLQALVLRRFAGIRSRRGFVALLALSCLTWCLSVTLTYTTFKDWILGALPQTGLSSVSFVFAFFIVLASLARGGTYAIAFNARRAGAYAFALAAIVEGALRTDHLTSDWIFYHRSYFADVANLVRGGHWLLWDVPSQYGFLSIATIAITPGKNGWQSLYVLTAVLLTAQALMTFAILYHGRRRWPDFLLALFLPLATYFGAGVSRYPFDARLYPQGGLRFVWIVTLIYVAFAIYVNRDKPRVVRTLRAIGYVVWAVSVLWSFETGIWSSIVWLAYVCTEATVEATANRPSLGRMLRIFSIRLLPFVAIPLLMVGALESIYRAALGHGPDLISYVEFSSVYAADSSFHDLVDRHGPAWTLLLILGALGSLGVIAARTKRYDALPLIATAWLATWVTTSYWVGESFNNHAIAAYDVAIPAVAIVVFLSREAFDFSQGATFARLSVAPIAILLVALLFGEPARMAEIKAPFVPGWSFDSTRDFPTITGELASLIKRAGIEPTDRLLLPNSVGWAKVSTGIIMPFVRMPDGSVSEYRSWLPVSPQGVYNTIESLPLERRTTYLERYLDGFRGSAWYVTYRERGGCALLSPRLQTIRSVESPNFTASACRMR